MRSLPLLVCLVIACHLAAGTPCIRSRGFAKGGLKQKLIGKLVGSKFGGGESWKGRGKEYYHDKEKHHGDIRGGSGRYSEAPAPNNNNVQNIVHNNHITVINNSDNKNNINNINSYQGQAQAGSASQGSSGASQAAYQAGASQAAYQGGASQSSSGASESAAAAVNYAAGISKGASALNGYGGYGGTAQSGYAGAAQGAYAESVKAATSSKETYRKVEEGTKESSSQYEASRAGVAAASAAAGTCLTC